MTPIDRINTIRQNLSSVLDLSDDDLLSDTDDVRGTISRAVSALEELQVDFSSLMFSVGDTKGRNAGLEDAIRVLAEELKG